MTIIDQDTIDRIKRMKKGVDGLSTNELFYACGYNKALDEVIAILDSSAIKVEMLSGGVPMTNAEVAGTIKPRNQPRYDCSRLYCECGKRAPEEHTRNCPVAKHYGYYNNHICEYGCV